MGRKKRAASIFSETDQEKNCMDFLRERGYAIFKADSTSQVEEEEAVRKLRAVGYRVEHIKDALIKVDPTKIRTVDDVAVYFHEMMSRFNPRRHNRNRLKNKSLRLVDHSIINSFIGWRIDEGASLADAIEDLFLLIDLLFEKAEPWNFDIRGLGILSIHSNRPFVMALMKEVKLKKDDRLEFEIEQLKLRQVEEGYMQVLVESRERMDAVGSTIQPLKRTRKTIKERKNV
jgi:hypothetical protein